MKVTTKETYTIEGNGEHVAIIDFGIKENILRSFKAEKLQINNISCKCKCRRNIKG